MYTPRQRVEAALLGRLVDEIPLTIDYNEFFLCPEERELRNHGMCVVEQRVPLYTMKPLDFPERTIHYRGDDGVDRLKRIIETPQGTISEVHKQLAAHPRIPGELMPWNDEYLFKGPEDYAPIESLIRCRQYAPNHESFRRMQEQAGGDVYFQTGLGYSPLQEIIYNIMGVEQFAVEWHFRRDKVLELYQALTEDRRKIYPLIAESPAIIVGYCGNIQPEVVGLDRFNKYLLPHYNELGEMLHERGKLLSVHFDGKTKLLAAAIAKSQVDVVESFTPYPEGDMSLAEARAAWPDKILWINFPSSLHNLDVSAVEEATRQLLCEAGRGDRFLIGIKELVPKDRWQAGVSAIARVLNVKGRLPLR
jgi:hypothetical protein